jgi:hypothetical protein
MEKKTNKKRLVIPASIAVLTLAGACQTTPNTDDPCTKAYGPDCASAETADGGFVELPDGGLECFC